MAENICNTNIEVITDIASCSSQCVMCSASVATGFEDIAAKDSLETLGTNCKISHCSQGRVFFSLPLAEIYKLKWLRSVDNLYAIVANFPSFCTSNKEETLTKLQELPSKLQWTPALESWLYFNSKSPKCILPLSEEERSSEDRHDFTKFRVTCYRAGAKIIHSFASQEAAVALGGACQNYFGWTVNLSNPDIEIILWVTEDNSISIGVSLTKQSLHHRNIIHFGPTTLRSTIAHCMCRMANIKPGEMIIDPLSGTGAIPIEAALSWPCAFYLSGDNHEYAASNSCANLKNVNNLQVEMKKGNVPINFLRWDATNLPIRSQTIDAVISDLPFGKRIGKKFDNWKLYPSLLSEFARIIKVNTGRAILLTYDTKCLSRVLHQQKLWASQKLTWINLGGLHAAVYVLLRTAVHI